MNFLACDLGGTKVLLGIFEKVINDDSPKLLYKKKYRSSDWESFELILKELRQSIGSIKEIYLYGLQKIFLKRKFT